MRKFLLSYRYGYLLIITSLDQLDFVYAKSHINYAAIRNRDLKRATLIGDS